MENKLLKKNFGLTEESFYALKLDLQNGGDNLIEVFYLKHFSTCCNHLIYNLHADRELAYESTMDALLELRKDLIRGKIEYGNLAYYFTERAKKVLYKKRLKSNAKMHFTDIQNFDFESDEDLEFVLSLEEVKSNINQAISKLGGACEKLIRLHYYDEISFEKIAQMTNSKASTIRVKALRCRNKLESLLKPTFSTY